MDYLALTLGLLFCGAAGWFGASKLKFIDLFTLMFLLLAGNYMIGQALK